MTRLLLLTAMLALAGCIDREKVFGSVPALPQYEADMVGTVYGSTSYGDFNLQLEFLEDAGRLVAVLTRLDGLMVEFDVESEFFPYANTLPSYFVLTPRQPWSFPAYVPPEPNSYPTLLLDCYLYTQNGNAWPPSGFDNFSQIDPVWPLFFFRIS